MHKVILLLIALAAYPFAAIPSLTLPNEDINGVDTPQVVWVDQNFDSVKVRVNHLVDTANIYLPGSGVFLGTFYKSLTNARVGIDFDANATGNYFWLSHNAADTLFRVRDDSSVYIPKLTAALPVFTNASKELASNAMTGTGSVVMSASPTLTGTAGLASLTTSGTIVSTGQITASGGVLVSGGTGTVQGTIFQSAVTGLGLRGQAGSSYDIGLLTAAGGSLLVNATGTNNLAVGNSSGTTSFPGAVTMASTLGVTGTVTADSLISAKFYTEDTFTGTLTGVDATVTGTLRYVRVGKSVTLMVPQLLGTSNTTSCSVTGMPAAIRPGRAVSFIAQVVDNSGITGGAVDGFRIGTDGVITLFKNGLTTGFTASGVKGLYSGVPNDVGAPSTSYMPYHYTLQ